MSTWPASSTAASPRRPWLQRLRGSLGSLGSRFSLLAGAVALLMATVSAGISHRLAWQDAEDNARSTLEGLAMAVKNTAAVGAYAQDRVLLDEVTQGLTSHPMVGQAQIRLLTPGEAARPLVSAPGEAPALRVALHSPFNANEVLGHLELRADPQVLASGARARVWRSSMPLFVQVLLLTVLLGWLARWLLSQPMARLAEQVAALAPGATQPLPVPAGHQRDEIGRLVRRMNQLVQANAEALDLERELRAEVSAIEGRLRRLLNASSAAIFLLDEEGRLLQSNATLVRLCTGSSQGRLDGAAFVETHFAQPEQLHALRRRALQEGRSASADLRLQRNAPDGDERWAHVLLSPLAGEGGATLVEGVLYDVSQRRREEAHARHEAQHDALTGLRNRAGLRAELDRAAAVALAGGTAVSLLYVDLDGFKAVNDSRGHDAGDAVLREVARRLAVEARRAGDVVARLGGDEFVLVLQAGPEAPYVQEIAWRITRSLAEPIELPGGGAPACIGASVGMAGLPSHALDVQALMSQADHAMYLVKHAGKNGVATPEGLLPRPPARAEALA
ncbi:hypothetical protein IP87_16205 [beta proteobacterium AAP121]|nr:hypothetical protein IP80_10345 [beta proteobacterium AAP65]KPF95684.1 hypothetical protein IP87_16205 [beta proteobacterium AAP121]